MQRPTSRNGADRPPPVENGAPPEPLADGTAGVATARAATQAGSSEQLNQAQQPSRLARLDVLIGDRRSTIAALAVCAIFAGVAEATILVLIAQIAASLVDRSKQAHEHISLFHIHAGVGTLIQLAFVLTIVRISLQVPLAKLPARIAVEVQARLRRELFDAYSRASWAVQSRDREGQLQETITGQVNTATGGALQATTLITSSFTFLVLMITALRLSLVAAVVVGFATVLLFGGLRPLRNRVVRSARELSRSQVAFAGSIAESVRVVEEMHVLGVAGAQRDRIEGFSRGVQRHFFRTQLLGKLIGGIYQSVIYLLLVGGVAGFYYFAKGDHAAALGGVVLLLIRAGSTGQNVQSAYQGIAQSMPFIERTQEAIAHYKQAETHDAGAPLAGVETMGFENVAYAYREGTPVLSDISFEVSRGEVVGIIGPSGAGKSTLVQLLLRLRLPKEGRYLVNGVSANEFAEDDWHRLVSYVPQEPRLLHASVADNIRFFRDIDDEAVERAARHARIHDDIVGWAKGYETLVGPRADAVSGGQQQRICLARALAARPEILVLDEPTSALDPHSEALIGESLTALKSELTLFIIAHRMSTLDMCDRVMVIVDGRLVAFDTKARLQSDNSYYRHASAIATGTAER
jgi:ABC-type multidrug transport system fused ATPase/permease subunit